MSDLNPLQEPTMQEHTSRFIDIGGKALIITDEEEMARANAALDLCSVLWDFDQWLRSEYKYGGVEYAYDIRDKLHQVMDAHNIDLDKLYK